MCGGGVDGCLGRWEVDACVVCELDRWFVDGGVLYCVWVWVYCILGVCRDSVEGEKCMCMYCCAVLRGVDEGERD